MKTDRQIRRRRNGFTLLELIIVILLVTTIVGLGLPSFKGLFTHTTEEQLKSHLSKTILVAIGKSSLKREAKEVVFDLDKGSYWVQDGEKQDNYYAKKKKEVVGRLPKGYSFKGVYFARGGAMETGGEVILKVCPDGTTEDVQLDVARLDEEDREMNYLRMTVVGSTGRSVWKSMDDLNSDGGGR